MPPKKKKGDGSEDDGGKPKASKLNKVKWYYTLSKQKFGVNKPRV